MTMSALQNGRYAPPSLVFEELERRSVANYERDLGRYRCAADRLRKELVRAKALLRQKDELIQRQAVLGGLFARREDAAKRVASLTSRERQIMDLVLAGQPSKNIAADLGISRRTVECHRASIMKKTGSKSIPALARLALGAAWQGAEEPMVQPLARRSPPPETEPETSFVHREPVFTAVQRIAAR